MKRPSIAQVCDAFSKFPKFISSPEGKSATELPGRVKLLFKSIKVSFDRSKQQPFSVKLKYGNREYMTSPTKFLDASSGHTWFVLCPFLPSLPSLSLKQEWSGELVV